MKGLTGSQSLIEILNQLGDTASYPTIEELEAKLTFQATESGNCAPTGMSLHLEQATVIAFDNFDW